MNIPWFMHMHDRQNTNVGVFPTPCGTFVRSWTTTGIEVAWYPMGHSFPGGGSRTTQSVFNGAASCDERNIEEAVAAFMHAHPVLCLSRDLDQPFGEPYGWDVGRSGITAVMDHELGDFVRFHRNGEVVVELMAVRDDMRQQICRLSDACGVELAMRRADERVRRFLQKQAVLRAAA